MLHKIQPQTTISPKEEKLFLNRPHILKYFFVICLLNKKKKISEDMMSASFTEQP